MKVLFLLIASIAATLAFQLAGSPPRGVRLAASTSRPLLRMQETPAPPEDDARAAYDAAVKAEGEVEAGTTIYDDDKAFVEKPPISDAMREKLLRGQKQLGSDPNSKNPFLYVFGAVGVFVLLGALAINM